METNNIQIVPVDQEEKSAQTVNFADIFAKCKRNWHWFALSVLACMVLAGVYILRSRTIYGTTATVLIKEASARRMATSDIESVINFSGGTMSSKVVNEVIAFKSPALMRSVVERLELNTEYTVRKMLRTDVLYASQSPISVKFLDIPNSYSAKLTVSQDGEQFTISKLSYRFRKEKVKVKEVFTANFGDTLATPVGNIVVERNPLFDGEWKKPIGVSHCNSMAKSTAFLLSFKAVQTDTKNKSDVITLTMSDASAQRACDILNTIIAIYNENWVEDKNRMAVSTTEFIDERLVSLEKELGIVDEDISSYMSDNLIVDAKLMSDLYMREGQEMNAMIREAETRMYVFRYLKTFLKDNKNKEVVIPIVASFNNHGVGEQITEYNKLLLKRNDLRDNSSSLNPLVVSMSKSLVSMRDAIEISVDQQIGNIEAQVAELRRTGNIATQKISHTPKQTKYLANIGRQQKVKETLYIYLLQKREENELSQAFTAYNTRIINPPMVIPGTLAPKSKLIVLLAFFLGLVIPFLYIYFATVLDDKVRTRNEIESLAMPFIGEIPQYQQKKSGAFAWMHKDVPVKDVVVKEGCRDLINESFRILRTNVEFMTRNQDCPVMSLTSFQPGSGKTFLSMNMSSVLAIRGKRVLVIDGDMRHASLSEFVGSPKKGLSTYLSGQTEDYHDVIVKYPKFKTLDVIPSGAIPPNPSELICTPRFAEMIHSVRNEYDYVILDCPPIDVVADTQIMQDLVDRSIFVVRAGLLEKKMLPKLARFTEEKNFKNLSLILNGTTSFGGGYYGSTNSYYHKS